MSTRYVTSFFEVGDDGGEECIQEIETLVPVVKGQKVYVNAGDSKQSKGPFVVIETPTIGIYTNNQVPQIVDTVDINVMLKRLRNK